MSLCHSIFFFEFFLADTCLFFSPLTPIPKSAKCIVTVLLIFKDGYLLLSLLHSNLQISQSLLSDVITVTPSNQHCYDNGKD